MFYQCGICGEDFMEAKNLESHIRCSHLKRHEAQDATFECYICHTQLKSMCSTRDHLSKKHKSIGKRCLVCLVQLSSIEFKWHLCGGKIIKCEYCSMSFETTSSLLMHINNTHNEKRFYFCEICPRKFSMRYLKDFHIEQHKNEERTFVCDVCSKSFAQKHLLTSHRKRHFLEENSMPSQNAL